jgi:predicted ribosome quality control (RQC) complex YloA/Tae2 family protein
MPFDGIVTKSVVNELSEMLSGGRIEKVYQPDPDEIVLNIRSKGKNFRLVLSANASNPRIHLTGEVKDNPAAAPMFCMLLRKHLSGGKITGFEFCGYERIVSILVESLNELGDLTEKKLIAEIMGKHSNIILLNNENKIIDSIKHIDSDISSVREVMPARPYTLPPAQDKINPEEVNTDSFLASLASSSGTSVEKYLLNNIKGFSPLICREICFRAGLDAKAPVSGLAPEGLEKLGKVLSEIIHEMTYCKFRPCIIYEGDSTESPLDFHCIWQSQYTDVRQLPSINETLELFYSSRDRCERLKARKAGLLKLINNNLDRVNKKLALQQEKMRESEDREKFKLYGELITANIYCIPKNTSSVSLLNYYSENGEYIDIPLDENLTPQENAQKYFNRYAKAKSAFNNTSLQINESMKELEYLESVLQTLESIDSLHEIDEIRQELGEQGYLASSRKSTARKSDKPSVPLLYKSSDGFDILVGKNNRQNDLLTMKTASSSDIWLHTRNIPGSHVIIRRLNRDIPDRTLLEAAMLAAHHSRSRLSSNVPVDYTAVKDVKKPPGAKPGMVIYEKFKTIIVTPDEKLVNSLKADKQK